MNVALRQKKAIFMPPNRDNCHLHLSKYKVGEYCTFLASVGAR